jgi:uncharacterized protein (TIGR02145 family)
MKNHYLTLGLEEGASQEAIQEAYERLYKELDPVKNKNQEFFIEEFEKLQAAYKVLRNSSILSATSETSDVSNLSAGSSVVKETNKKLKPQKVPNELKIKNTKLIIVVITFVICGLTTYLLFKPKQHELSQITLKNDITYSAFTRADMKPVNGIVKGYGLFINGIAEGEHDILDKNENSIASGYYKNGKKQGVWREWYPIKDGEWYFWYEKGLPKKECNFRDGKLVGEYKSWFENGQLEKVGTYKNGFENGEWSYYDRKGELLAHFNFDGEIWAKRNLDVSRYRNGDIIPEVQDSKEWASIRTGAWCYYNNETENGKIYGKLYNWYAVNDPRGLAPEGYHIPSNLEWRLLINHLGGEQVAGHKMKEEGTEHWKIINHATNISSFTALPGGFRHYDGRFVNIGGIGNWWSSSQGDYDGWDYYAWVFSLSYFNGSASRDLKYKEDGISVRCFKN